MARRVLFVDDEPNILDGIKRMLRPYRQDWEMMFATSGALALEQLDKVPVDVVISDVMMPGMNGVELLSLVADQHPGTARIILSGHMNKELAARSIGPAHQYLTKPCRADDLVASISSVCDLRDKLSDSQLVGMVTSMKHIPSAPKTYLELIDLLHSPAASVASVGDVIARDPSLSAKVLQMANSAFFALPQTVSSPAHAATILGLDTLKALVLAANVASELSREQIASFPIESLWAHSLRVGTRARKLCEIEGTEKMVADQAFIAGMLHDIGKLLLAMNAPTEYRQVLSDSGVYPAHEIESRLWDVSHSEVGGYVIGIWGLPTAIVDAVFNHHRPSDGSVEGFSPTTAVHIANHLSRDMGLSHAPAELDMALIGELRLEGRIEEWQVALQGA